MRQIYEGAELTVIWLGKAWDGLPLAVSAIATLAAASAAGRMAALKGDCSGYANMEGLMEAQDLPDKDSRELRELDKFLQNPWFTRAWAF
jgi:Heterokaryon incompatibility protein (HET)